MHFTLLRLKFLISPLTSMTDADAAAEVADEEEAPPLDFLSPFFSMPYFCLK